MIDAASEGSDTEAFEPFPDHPEEEIKQPQSTSAASKKHPKLFANRLSKEDIRLVYRFEKVLGTGNFGTARLASKLANPAVKFAIKSIPRVRIEQDTDMFEQELGILLSVDHPNIVKFYEAFLDHKYVHLVMELCHGGELFQRLIQIKTFSEDQTRSIIKQTL